MNEQEFKPKTVIPFDAIRIYIKGTAHLSKVEMLQGGQVISSQDMDWDIQHAYLTLTGIDAMFDPSKVQK